MKHIARILLFPLAALYGVLLWLRNKLFDWGVLKQTSFNLPVIVVGNITTGGTGKTPHTEYIVNLLGANDAVATLSRGYGRKSRGFFWVDADGAPDKYGDEPLQIKRKYPQVNVAVCEKRVQGINTILSAQPQTKAIVLDDAFQHRYVKPGLSIVLVDYHNLPYDDYLLPSGNLREPVSSLHRADVIIVTKTPHFFSPLEREGIIHKLKAEDKPVFFSYYKYGELQRLKDNELSLEADTHLNKDSGHDVLLLTGLANAAYMKDHLAETLLRPSHHLEFKDHHTFTVADIEKLTKNFSTIAGKKKLVVTSEKDAIRLKAPEVVKALNGLPLFYLPVEVAFHGNDKEAFDKLVSTYVRSY